MQTRPGRQPRLVVAAVIRRRDGRYLVAQRPKGAHLGGLWEFPGGAVEVGEQPPDALQRELEEELGVEIEVGAPLTFGWHRDGERDVLLLFYETRLTRGRPHGRQGQAVRWVTAEELALLPIPPADAELVRLLSRVTAPRHGAAPRRRSPLA